MRASIAAHDPANRSAASPTRAARATLPTPVEAAVVDRPLVDGTQEWLDAAPRKKNDL